MAKGNIIFKKIENSLQWTNMFVW